MRAVIFTRSALLMMLNGIGDWSFVVLRRWWQRHKGDRRAARLRRASLDHAHARRESPLGHQHQVEPCTLADELHAREPSLLAAIHTGCSASIVAVHRAREVVTSRRNVEPTAAPWQRPTLKSTLVSKPALSGAAVAYVQDVLCSGWWGYGPVAQHLQATIESLYEGRQNALATSSCTAAMHLALRAAGVGPGDEVIVPAFTYVSTAVGAIYCGAEPVFADIDPATLTLSAQTVAPLLSERTRAIIPMHYAGPPADFEPIRELVAGRNITVIEDAAHAFGSIRDGKRVGAGAEFSAFSFAPTKQIASSNGGILLYRDGERRTEINQLASLGLAADAYHRMIARGRCPDSHIARIGLPSASPPQLAMRIGYRYKLEDLAASLICASLERLDEIVAHRAALVERYYHQLEGVDELELMPRSTNAAISWYIMPIRVPVDKRDRLRAELATQDIDTAVHYPNLREQPAFRRCRGDVPVTARESRRVISLPLHHGIQPGEVDRICDTVRAFLR